jgi:hypothetical protein
MKKFDFAFIVFVFSISMLWSAPYARANSNLYFAQVDTDDTSSDSLVEKRLITLVEGMEADMAVILKKKNSFWAKGRRLFAESIENLDKHSAELVRLLGEEKDLARIQNTSLLEVLNRLKQLEFDHLGATFRNKSDGDQFEELHFFAFRLANLYLLLLNSRQLTELQEKQVLENLLTFLSTYSYEVHDDESSLPSGIVHKGFALTIEHHAVTIVKQALDNVQFKSNIDWLDDILNRKGLSYFYSGDFPVSENNLKRQLWRDMQAIRARLAERLVQTSD